MKLNCPTVIHLRAQAAMQTHGLDRPNDCRSWGKSSVVNLSHLIAWCSINFHLLSNCCALDQKAIVSIFCWFSFKKNIVYNGCCMITWSSAFLSSFGLKNRPILIYIQYEYSMSIPNFFLYLSISLLDHQNRYYYWILLLDFFNAYSHNTLMSTCPPLSQI